jgi:hypothetical protein
MFIFLAGLILPTQALANPIAPSLPEEVITIILLVIPFIIIFESFFLYFIAKLTIKQSLWISILANTASTIVGIPFGMFWEIDVNGHLLYIFLNIGSLFLVACFCEGWIAYIKYRKYNQNKTTVRLWMGVIFGNIATYIAISILYFI